MFFSSFFLSVVFILNLGGDGSCSFPYIASLSSLSFSDCFHYVCVHSLMDAQKLTLPTAMSACCCVGSQKDEGESATFTGQVGKAQ